MFGEGATSRYIYNIYVVHDEEVGEKGQKEYDDLILLPFGL
jgi:hypothetical protein